MEAMLDFLQVDTPKTMQKYDNGYDGGSFF